MIDSSNLRTLLVNTKLKKESSESHTKLLMNASAAIMRAQGVTVEMVHLLDHQMPPGIYPDMTVHGRDRNAWDGGERFGFENPRAAV